MFRTITFFAILLLICVPIDTDIAYPIISHSFSEALRFIVYSLWCIGFAYEVGRILRNISASWINCPW